MGVLAFPPRPLNDNEREQFWVCSACQQGAFVLISDAATGLTTIECAMCRIDVTGLILPHLPVGVSLQGG